MCRRTPVVGCCSAEDDLMRQEWLILLFLPLGAVQKVSHAIFDQFWPPSLSHFDTHLGTPLKYVTHLGPPDF